MLIIGADFTRVFSRLLFLVKRLVSVVNND